MRLSPSCVASAQGFTHHSTLLLPTCGAFAGSASRCVKRRQEETAAPAVKKGKKAVLQLWKVTGYIRSEIEIADEWVFDECQDFEMGDMDIQGREEYPADEVISHECKSLREANKIAREEFITGLVDSRNEQEWDFADVIAALEPIMKITSKNKAIAEIRSKLQWGKSGDAKGCKCELDAQGCAHYCISFNGQYSKHDSQNCEVKADVSPAAAR